MARGMDVESALIAAEIYEAELPRKSPGAIRVARHRERDKALQSVTRNEGNVPPLSPSFSPQTPQNHPHTPPSNNTRTRGSRLPDDWLPDDWLPGLTLGEEALRGELDKFRDYWRSVPGAKGLKLDWDATWRNWLRKASENTPRKAQHDGPHYDAKFDAKQANLARAWTGSERAARFRGEL